MESRAFALQGPVTGATARSPAGWRPGASQQRRAPPSPPCAAGDPPPPACAGGSGPAAGWGRSCARPWPPCSPRRKLAGRDGLAGELLGQVREGRDLADVGREHGLAAARPIFRDRVSPPFSD